MEDIPGGQPDTEDRKPSIHNLDSVRSLDENLRKEQTVVRMGHGARRGTPPHRWSEAVQVRVLRDVAWETHYQNTRQKRC